MLVSRSVNSVPGGSGEDPLHPPQLRQELRRQRQLQHLRGQRLELRIEGRHPGESRLREPVDEGGQVGYRPVPALLRPYRRNDRHQEQGRPSPVLLGRRGSQCRAPVPRLPQQLLRALPVRGSPPPAECRIASAPPSHMLTALRRAGSWSSSLANWSSSAIDASYARGGTSLAPMTRVSRLTRSAAYAAQVRSPCTPPLSSSLTGNLPLPRDLNSRWNQGHYADRPDVQRLVCMAAGESPVRGAPSSRRRTMPYTAPRSWLRSPASSSTRCGTRIWASAYASRCWSRASVSRCRTDRRSSSRPSACKWSVSAARYCRADVLSAT
jgi:hypothetical protein